MEFVLFNIYVIGDLEKLKVVILEDGSYVRELMFRKLYVEIDESDKIIMFLIIVNINVKYMKIVEVNK